MRVFATALLAVTIAAGPSLADEAQLGGFALEAVFNTVDDGWQEPITQPWVTYTMLGHLPIVFEKTTLYEVAQEFGTGVQSEGTDGDAISWICFANERQTIWLVGEPQPNEYYLPINPPGTIFWAGIEQNKSQKRWNCELLNDDLALDFGFSAFGATEQALQAELGKGYKPAEDRYMFTSKFTPESGAPVHQTLHLRLGTDAKVDAVGISQYTGP